MDFCIKGPKGDVIATALSACSARRKFRAGRRLYGGQTLYRNGVACSELEIEALCALEEGCADGGAGRGWRFFL